MRRSFFVRPPHRRLLGSSYAFAVPSYLALSLLTLFPLIYIFALALTKSSLGKPFQAYVGSENVLQAIESAAFADSLVRTIVFAVVAAVLQLVLGTALALLLQARNRGFGALGVVILLPLITPPVMVGVAWQLLLAPSGGGLSSLWALLGIPGFNAFGSGGTAFFSLLLIEVWQWTPFAVLMIYVALLTVDRQQIEASMLDGANLWHRFRAVIYPAIAPVLLTVLVIRILGGFKAFDVAYVITQGGPGMSTTFTTFEIYRTALNGAFNTGLAAAETIILGLVIGAVTWIVTIARRRAARVAL